MASFSPLLRGLVWLRGPLTTMLLGLGLLPFFALSFYNYPFWDDFGNALSVKKLGYWGAQKDLYLNWSGRYAANFLQTVLNPLTYDWMGGFYFSPLLLLSGTILALYFLLRELSSRRLSHAKALRGALLLLLLSLAWMPTIYPTFYWFTAGVAYQTGIIFLLLLLAAGLQALRARVLGSRCGWYLLALLSTIVVAGLNEVALLLLGWTLLALVAISWQDGRRRAASYWGGLLLTAVLAGLAAVLAPGNLARLHPNGHTSRHRSLLSVMRYAIEHCAAFLSTPSYVIPLLLAPLLLAPLLIRLRHWRPAGFRLPLGWGVALLLLGVGGSFVFFAFITTNGLPGRTLSFLWSWLLLGWIGVLWAAVPDQLPVAVRQTLAYTQQPATLFVGFLLLAGIERHAWDDLLRSAPAWRAQHEARFARFRSAAQRGQRTAVVNPFTGFVPHHISIIGETLYYHPGNRDEQHNNSVTAQWFGLDSVNLSAPSKLGRVGEDL